MRDYNFYKIAKDNIKLQKSNYNAIIVIFFYSETILYYFC